MNASFWDVFWGPTTGKVHFVAKKLGNAPQTGIGPKKRFRAQKVQFPGNGGKPQKVVPFLL